MPDGLPEYLSVSQITSYLMCPRKYRYRYLDHLVPEKRSVELALGSAVHASIGWWLERRVKGELTEAAAIDRTFRVDWHSEQFGPPLDLGDHTASDLVTMGRSLVELFIGGSTNDSFSEATRVEERFEVGVPGLPVPLVGYYDFVDGDVLGEIKTSSRKASWRNWGMQLAAYSHARRMTNGRLPVVRLITLIKTKTPTVEKVDVVVPEGEIAWFVEVATEVHRSLRREAFHPNPGFICMRCEYRRACRGIGS